MNQQTQIDELEEILREIYKTNDGPRLIAEVMKAFPNPRKVWNEPSGSRRFKRPGGWGMRATEYPRL